MAPAGLANLPWATPPSKNRTRRRLALHLARRRRVLLAFSLSVTAIFLWTFPLDSFRSLQNADRPPPPPPPLIEVKAKRAWLPNKPNDRPYLFNDATGNYHDRNLTCPIAWRWTEDREKADVIWFDVLGGPPATPKAVASQRAYPEQLLAFYSLESGAYYDIVYRAKDLGYNFSVDYRVWGGHPRGDPDIPAVYMTNPSAPDFDLDFRKAPAMPKRKDALMAVFIRNCEPRNNRTLLLKEIMALMPVHSYGSCEHNIDEPAPVEGEGPLPGHLMKRELASQYHFLLAMENSNDNGYVTEKVTDAFHAGTIPVYLGAPDIKRMVPHPDSVIDINDFKTTQELVDHMKALVADDATYLKQFEWKQKEFSDDFKRVWRLATRTVQCRLAMHLEGLNFEVYDEIMYK